MFSQQNFIEPKEKTTKVWDERIGAWIIMPGVRAMPLGMPIGNILPISVGGAPGAAGYIWSKEYGAWIRPWIGKSSAIKPPEWNSFIPGSEQIAPAEGTPINFNVPVETPAATVSEAGLDLSKIITIGDNTVTLLGEFEVSKTVAIVGGAAIFLYMFAR